MSGKLNFCAIILACKEKHAKYMMGIQPCAELVGNETNFDDNSDGIDKFIPMDHHATTMDA